MKHFSKPNKAKININLSKIDQFIEIFNRAIKAYANTSYSKNSSLDNIPILSNEEFEIAKERANVDGFLLTVIDDNYQSKTYKLSLIRWGELVFKTDIDK